MGNQNQGWGSGGPNRVLCNVLLLWRQNGRLTESSCGTIAKRDWTSRLAACVWARQDVLPGLHQGIQWTITMADSLLLAILRPQTRVYEWVFRAPGMLPQNFGDQIGAFSDLLGCLLKCGRHSMDCHQCAKLPTCWSLQLQCSPKTRCRWNHGRMTLSVLPK